VDNRQTPYVVAAGPAVVLCFVLAVDDVAPSFARGHAEQRCSGTCPQQARSSSAPYLPGRAGPRIVPWTWIGQTPRPGSST
jgi:hypothetical protein